MNKITSTLLFIFCAVSLNAIEWPKKMWEIQFDFDVNSVKIGSIGNNGETIFASISGRGYLITKFGEYYELPEGWNNPERVLFLEGKSIVYHKTTFPSRISLFQVLIDDTTKLTDFDGKFSVPRSSGKGIPQSSHLGVQKIDDNKFICWDFTPPTPDSTDNEGDNEAPKSQLVVKNAGRDISIATDGKLGGPVELQKSDDLKNWLRMRDVSEDANEVFVTPKESGNEFFRLKRIDE